MHVCAMAGTEEQYEHDECGKAFEQTRNKIPGAVDSVRFGYLIGGRDARTTKKKKKNGKRLYRL